MAEVKKTDPMEELVEIELFYDGEKYTDDVPVSVNGETILIKRGEKVKVKRKFAQVLEDASAQNKAAANLMHSLQNDYKRKEKALN